MTKHYLLLLSAATLLLTAAYTYDAPEPITAQAAPVPQTSQEQWAYDLAVALGNTQPTGDTIRFLVAWQRAEGTSAEYNPLATSQDMPGATIFNSHGVKEYLSYQDGITATAITLGYDYSGYATIRDGIRTNDVALALQGLYASPWGTNADNVAALYNSTVSSPAPLGAMTGSIRSQVITLALAEVGKPYVLGDEGPDRFDCSGLVQYVYGKLGIETTRTTYTQLDALRTPDVIQEGDMVYFQYPWDQHVGILADLDNDGAWDMIHAAAPGVGVVVDYNVFAIPFFRDAVIGYRSAVDD